jgi:hypothetical protein
MRIAHFDIMRVWRRGGSAMGNRYPAELPTTNHLPYQFGGLRRALGSVMGKSQTKHLRSGSPFARKTLVHVPISSR